MNRRINFQLRLGHHRALIALIGAMLLYGAFNAPIRPVVLIIAATSKAIFIALVLSQGERYLLRQAALAIAIDFIMILLFCWYLLAVRREGRISPHIPSRKLPKLTSIPTISCGSYA